MTVAGVPMLVSSIKDEERRAASGPPVDPPAPGPDGRVYPTDPVWNPTFSGSSPSFNPASPASSGGGKFTYHPGTWDTYHNGRKREPTVGDSAYLDFTSNGSNVRFLAGRIDNTDRTEMDADDVAFDGSLNGVGSGFDGKPFMLNSIITGGQGIKDGPFDPAVFPFGSEAFPDGRGPHRHSLTAVQDSYWTDSTLRGELGGLPDPSIDLGRSFLENVVFRTRNGGNFRSGMIAYWPEFVDGIKNNGFSQTGYIGRPRPLTGLRSLPLYLGDVVPPPQGLRMFSFECNIFKNARGWEFIAVWPNCWDGVNEWLDGGTHVTFLRPDGTPPPSHPFVIPQIHWFASTFIPESLTQDQAKRRQSAQVVDDNPAATYFGRRRDYWNYNNVNVPLHAELLLAWDPTLAEAICWMINNGAGLGRITQVTVS